MWPFKRTLCERYSKLVKLIKSVDTHFVLTEDTDDSLRLHLPNYKGNQPIDFHIYLMEPLLFISFVTEIEGEKISYVSNFHKDTDQQDMFNASMSNNLNKIHQVLEDKHSDNEMEKKENPDRGNNSIKYNSDSKDNKRDNTEIMFCKYCGKRIEANSKFCIHCGKQLNQEVFVLNDFPGNIISAVPINSQEDLDEIITLGKESILSKDYHKAYFFLREAARFGDAESAFITGQLLFNGDGVEKDEERAISFFMQAAENGYVPAYNNIGVCFAIGAGVPKDISKAVSWYQKAADKGDMYAQNSLGRCYLVGDGVEKNLELGFYWTKKSAEQGYNGSLFNMGYCYEKGLGVPKDLSKAIRYYKEALEKGYRQAEQRLKLIE